MELKTIFEFKATVDPATATVVSFTRFIAVFGGALSKVTSKAKSPKSKRDAFVRWARVHRTDLTDHFLIPESYDDWKEFDTYSDLLLFESDLGFLTSVVVLFLEGPGAIAELGAFSQIESLMRRLLIVIEAPHKEARSFITLGPLRSLETTKKISNAVCVVPAGKPHELTAHMGVVIDSLTAKIGSPPARRALHKTDEQDRILLVVDLINLFQIVLISEIKELLLHFGISIGQKRMRQILFLLLKVKLVQIVEYGGNKWYAPLEFKDTYIDFSALAGRKFKRTSFAAKIRTEIDRDPTRQKVREMLALTSGAAK